MEAFSTFRMRSTRPKQDVLAKIRGFFLFPHWTKMHTHLFQISKIGFYISHKFRCLVHSPLVFKLVFFSENRLESLHN